MRDVKKVCILTSVHSAFDVRIFYKEAKALVKAGYNITLIAQHNKDEIVDGVKIIALPKAKYRLERMVKTICRVFRLALEQKADVYHFHDPELLLLVVFLKVFTKGKIIYDVHEHYPKAILDKCWIPKIFRRATSRIFAFTERILVAPLDLIIYTTPIVGERYKKTKIQTERIENYPLIELAESFERNPQKYIVYLGGITKIRGACELLKAFSIVVEKYPDWRLYLVGKIVPESFIKEIDRLISNLNMEESVRLISPVPYNEKEKYSSMASIGVVTYLPHANNMSCLPNKLFDYMLVGLPVVVSNFSLYREIVEGSKCGLCVDPSSPKEIAKAIEWLIEHPEEAKEMGENARRAVLEKYNWENESKKLLKVYEELYTK